MYIYITFSRISQANKENFHPSTIEQKFIITRLPIVPQFHVYIYAFSISCDELCAIKVDLIGRYEIAKEHVNDIRIEKRRDREN